MSASILFCIFDKYAGSTGTCKGRFCMICILRGIV